MKSINAIMSSTNKVEYNMEELSNKVNKLVAGSTGPALSVPCASVPPVWPCVYPYPTSVGPCAYPPYPTCPACVGCPDCDDYPECLLAPVSPLKQTPPVFVEKPKKMWTERMPVEHLDSNQPYVRRSPPVSHLFTIPPKQKGGPSDKHGYMVNHDTFPPPAAGPAPPFPQETVGPSPHLPAEVHSQPASIIDNTVLLNDDTFYRQDGVNFCYSPEDASMGNGSYVNL